VPGNHAIEDLLRDVIGALEMPDTESVLCPFIKPGKVPALNLSDNDDHMIVLKKTVPFIQYALFCPYIRLLIDIGTYDEVMLHLNDTPDELVHLLVLHAGIHDNLD
jgi:hypothetical protein